MSWTYSTNFMGPISLLWYEDNSMPYTNRVVDGQIVKDYVPYAGGRIDCYCDDYTDPDYSPFGDELSLPVMLGEHFDLFSDWLDSVETERLVTLEWLVEQFRNQTGVDIEFFKNKLNDTVQNALKT